MVRSGHVTDDVITIKVIRMQQFNATSDPNLYPDSHFFKIVHSSLNIYIFFSVPGQSEILHTNVLQTVVTAFSVTNYFCHSEQKRTSEQSHVTNDVITLRLTQELVYGKSYFYTTYYSFFFFNLILFFSIANTHSNTIQ